MGTTGLRVPDPFLPPDGKAGDESTENEGHLCGPSGSKIWGGCGERIGLRVEEEQG